MFTSLKRVFEFKYKISRIAKNFQEKHRILHQQHQELYDAIKLREPELAAQKMEAHLQFVEKEWIQDMQRYRAQQK
jgi:DNA-binding FadR family transcriptional regulator